MSNRVAWFCDILIALMMVVEAAFGTWQNKSRCFVSTKNQGFLALISVMFLHTSFTCCCLDSCSQTLSDWNPAFKLLAARSSTLSDWSPAEKRQAGPSECDVPLELTKLIISKTFFSFKVDVQNS